MASKYPCNFCKKSVRNNQYAMLCIVCEKWGHLKCSSDSECFFQSNADWTCDKCLWETLPLTDVSNSSITSESHSELNCPSSDENVNPVVSGVCDNVIQDEIDELQSHKGLKISHLNCLSLMKHFDEVKSLAY